MENYLYLILNILSFSIPFLYSFEKKRIHFIRHWKEYFTSIIIVGLFFVVWDIYFTYQGIWWFNEKYLIGFKLFKLPLEEWMFFLLIPYASNFIHYALIHFFPKPKLSSKQALIISWGLFIVSSLITAFNTDKMYTFCSFGFFSLIMLYQSISKNKQFQRYALSFIVIIIPFFVVNSWLTGSFTAEPVVCYNNTENLGIRIGTIPIEDTFYCFSMLYGSLLVFERLKKKNNQ